MSSIGPAPNCNEREVTWTVDGLSGVGPAGEGADGGELAGEPEEGGVGEGGVEGEFEDEDPPVGEVDAGSEPAVPPLPQPTASVKKLRRARQALTPRAQRNSIRKAMAAP
ncbi:MAG: hypothetical protein JO210_06860 [Acidobacteriaceae bacterium]|nr:hypothetical protein [Acidobacteriaceae bacterium]